MAPSQVSCCLPMWLGLTRPIALAIEARDSRRVTIISAITVSVPGWPVLASHALTRALASAAPLLLCGLQNLSFSIPSSGAPSHELCPLRPSLRSESVNERRVHRHSLTRAYYSRPQPSPSPRKSKTSRLSTSDVSRLSVKQCCHRGRPRRSTREHQS